ncbi:HERC2, partial [Symbiodinium sp. CCMP2592]
MQRSCLAWLLLVLPKSSCEFLEALFRNSGAPKPEVSELLQLLRGKAQEQWQLIEKQALMIRDLEQELERFKAELVLLKARRQAQ